MERCHREAVTALVPTAAPRTHLLGAFVEGASPDAEIADPVGQDLARFRACFTELRQALVAFLDWVADRH